MLKSGEAGRSVLRPYMKLLMVFGATAHPSSGQFTAEERVFRVECAGVGRVG
jgi:hypothetical protein